MLAHAVEFLTAGAMAALGDLLTAEFFLTTADTEEIGRLFCGRPVADNRWYINTKFLKSGEAGTGTGQSLLPDTILLDGPRILH